MKNLGLIAGALMALFLAGCASTRTPAPVVERPLPSAAPSTAAAPATGKDFYTVRRGDTLFSIAAAHGIDHRELAALNNIENPSRILVGQQLRLRPPGGAQGSEVAVARPIAGGGVIERRALEPAAPAPVASPPAPAATAPAAANSERVKREPQVGKEAYSDEAWARAQPRTELAVAAPRPAETPRPEPRGEPKPEAKPAEPRPAPADSAARPDEPTWIWPASGKVIGTFSESGSKGLDIAGKAGDPVLAASEGKVVYSGTGLRGYGKLVIIKHNAQYLSAYAHNQNILVKEGQSVTRGQKIAEMGNTDADQVKLHFEVRKQGKPVDPLKHLPPR